MPCSRKEALVRLFHNVTCTIKFFFLFFYLFSLFLAKLFTSLFRTEDEYDDSVVDEGEEEEYDDENVEVVEAEEVEEEEEEYYRYSNVERDHLVADTVNGDDALEFLPENFHLSDQNLAHAHTSSSESVFEDPVETFEAEAFHAKNSASSQSYHNDVDRYGGDAEYKAVQEEYTSTDEKMPPKSPIAINLTKKYTSRINGEDAHEQNDGSNKKDVKEETNFTRDEKFLIFEPPRSEAKKLKDGLEKDKDEAFEDLYTVGSTSKSSSEWRSSIRDSGTEDPFSSSSRRSCPKWESYTVYQKYDEEMMFLDRISAQKLHETESHRSFQVQPRSISQRIVHKLGNNKKKRSSDGIYQNPYYELEAAYVAQICLTWEALNWNYATFKRKQGHRAEPDPGCPAQVAQQFQQFQVLLQRYIENEPYERGRRPEIYARMRSVAPKLLQVPEYQDYEDEQKEEAVDSRITSTSFVMIMEDAIRTFMEFLKADRESHCQVIASLFKGRRRGLLDPTLIRAVKKHNKKKKLKVKDLQMTGKCFRKRKLNSEEEMEILMALIDLKVVSRVLRTADITQEQLQWCEDKMGKVKVLEGKLHRDSSPLFFPAH